VNELMTRLTENEKFILGNEIEKLFILQDRPIGKEKKTILVDELSMAGIPLQALFLALKKLRDEDLRAIKLATLKEAASEFIYRDPIGSSCGNCASGIIIAANAKKYLFSFACSCEQGMIRRRGLKIRPWDNSLAESGMWVRK